MNADRSAGVPTTSASLPPSTGCVVCGLDQDANQILLCDGCDAEYHIYCLVPPLEEIPEGDFYCKACKDAKRHLTPKPTTCLTSEGGPTQAGLTVQDEHGRMVPVRSEDVRESKYCGVLKLVHKGAKKPFVARIQKDGKFLQLGLFSSEIEAAHAYDKSAIQLFGRSAQLNFPHLHAGFVRAATAAAATATAPAPATATTTPVRPQATASSSAAAMASPNVATPGRGGGRGRGRGRGSGSGSGGRGSRGGAAVGGGGGRGKRRLEDSPSRDGSSAAPPSSEPSSSAVKKRKPAAVDTAAGDGAALLTGPKYLGVQAYRGYAHAQIVVNGKTVNLGTFPTPVDAAMAYDKAALNYFGGAVTSKNAKLEQVALNFPHKRDQLLKQLIEENMHQKARQASGGAGGSGGAAASSANRSMQSAKHNLSIKKLENWVLKLQRSVKLVEASHRVQWDGLPLVKPEEPDESEEPEAHQEIKLELLAGAGPTIKTDFTKKQQRLRSGAADIQDAVNLMIQELKIYADDTPVDAAFIAPPRSHALLDLMSTSRFLKLCSTINELAHFSVTSPADADKPLGTDDASGEESFEALVQVVVDYRTRLQMAASSEKQKLAGLVDAEANAAASADAPAGASTALANGSAASTDLLSREALRNAKYVKRKVQRITKVKKVVDVIDAAASAADVDEEMKEHESAVVVTTVVTTATVEEGKEAPSQAPAASVPEEPDTEEAATTEAMEVDEGSEAPAAAMVEEFGKTDDEKPANVSEAKATSDVHSEPVATADKAETEETAKADEDEQMAEVKADESPSVAVASSTEKPSQADDAAQTGEMSVEADATEASTEPSTAEKATEESKEADEVVSTEEPAAEPASDEPTAETALTAAGEDQAMKDAPVAAESMVAPAETADPAAQIEVVVIEPVTAVEEVVATEAPASLAEKVEVEETVTEDVWEYYLALKPQPASSRTPVEKDGLWRLLPLESERGEFVEDVYLTDGEISEIEVTEAEVCGGLRESDDKTSDSQTWAPTLTELHTKEVALRDRAKAEAERRSALEGVIKIEQERLSQVFVVYRRMLESISVKAGEAQKNHQRITRDLLLVELMKQTFSPILDELLQQCDSVFLQRLEKLSDRFEDFQQEFEYYADALASVTGAAIPSANDENGHLKAEEETPAAAALNGVVVAEALEDDDSSGGLRDAYVSFYMEEIEALWKERCRAVESLYAILRSLAFVETAKTPAPLALPAQPVEGEGEEPAEAPETPPEVELTTGPSLLRRRVLENLDQWKQIEWPARLASPSFMSSFLGDDSSRSASVASLLPSAKQLEPSALSSAMGELKQIIIDLTQESPAAAVSRVARHSTLVVYHPIFLDHQTPKDHPECPERLNRIITMLNTVRKKFDDSLKIDRLTLSPDELSPVESTLLAVHSPAYLDQLKSRSREAISKAAPGSRGSVSLAASALVFETNRGALDLPATDQSETRASPTGSMGGAFGAFNTVPNGIAMDTYVSSKSWDVARAAAGTVCLAVDRVVRKEFRNAACLVRPPGHHVGRHGRTLDAPSSGFCLLNNVVIGAVHARQYPWIRRVAVLDWDIHHGNGTEELMRDDPDGFFASVHLYASGKFFPGTGKAEQSDNLVNVALENVGVGSGSTAFRSALVDQILPAIRAFRPDMIFISAGFDGHKDDILGGRAAVKNTAVPAGYLEEDYVWATQEVLKLADECCDGRVVSVLEGGYDVRRETNSLAKSVAAHVGAIASYEQERQQKRASEELSSSSAEGEGKVKSESSLGVLLSLLAKDMNDDDVVIIDDDDDENDDDVVDKSGLLSNGNVDADVDVEDDDDLDDDDVEGDGVEVDEEDDATHGLGDHDDDVDEDVVMTDEGDHSADDDDAHSTGLSFAASLSVDGDDDDAQQSQEELDGGDMAMDGHPQLQSQGSRIETPEYDHDHLTGTGDEDDGMVGGHDDDDDDEGDGGDLLGDGDNDSVGELPSLS